MAEERRKFLIHCAELGLSDTTLRYLSCYLLSIVAYLRLQERPNDMISATEIESQADRWSKRPRTAARSEQSHLARATFLGYATRWLKFLGRWQASVTAPHRYADRIAEFSDHMRRERGLASATIHLRCRVAQEFIDCLCASRRMEEVTPSQVDEALVSQLKQGRASIAGALYRPAQS
jgi:hypothetical protein